LTALTIAGVRKSYGNTTVLRGVDLHVPHGSLTAVLGPSGCGKTTLLRLIAGFADADAGTISFGDSVVFRPGHSTKPQHRGAGYVPQEGALFPHLTVAANITFGLSRRQRGDRARVAELLDLVGLAANWPPATRTNCPAASSNASPWPGRSRRDPPWCCSTSRSRPWTRRCAKAPAGPSPPPCARRGRPPCWSPTTSPRRSPWPTRWA
jgi:ABC-type glutathione transport system ATPase component